MNNEANWHHITATLLREIDRLRSELAIGADNYASTKLELELLTARLTASPPAPPARVLQWLDGDFSENNEEEDGKGGEEYEESETESEQYWTDREYITDDAWEKDSDDDRSLSGQGSEGSSVERSGSESEEGSEEKDESGDGADDEDHSSYLFATPTPVERRKRKAEPVDEGRPVAMYVFGDIAGLPLKDQVGGKGV